MKKRTKILIMMPVALIACTAVVAVLLLAISGVIWFFENLPTRWILYILGVAIGLFYIYISAKELVEKYWPDENNQEIKQ